ncbi:MAG: Ti-type conjugative transfer relaxase TraA, partial [Gammaproteobacteria bacterium]
MGNHESGCATANGAMAKYFLHVKVFSRGKGSRVTRAAAYRAGERIRDERTSEVYNYSDRHDVLHKEIVLASQFAGRTDADWARDRAALWNAAEHAGRRNARLAREVLVTLPPELEPARRMELARTFARELADRYQSAVDLAVHEPRRDSDERHHHAHLLMTAREVTPEGLGRRTALELSGTERYARGLPSSKAELLWIRERWAQVTNQMLLDAG